MLTEIIRYTVFPTKELHRLIIASLGLTEHFEITARQSTSWDHKYISVWIIMNPENLDEMLYAIRHLCSIFLVI
jgi:hypothetical protein